MKKTILLNLLFFLLFIFLIESISRILNLANLTGTSSNLITYKSNYLIRILSKAVRRCDIMSHTYTEIGFRKIYVTFVPTVKCLTLGGMCSLNTPI